MLKKLTPAKSLAKLPRQQILDKLLRELTEREKLLKTVKPLLPQDVRDHCSQASIKNKCLLLFADSPVWAAKLRLCTQELPHVMGQRGFVLKKCQVRVSPPLLSVRSSTQGPPQGQRNAARISAATAAHLEQAAQSMPDTRLAACFQRIANHQRRTLETGSSSGAGMVTNADGISTSPEEEIPDSK
ncbi:DciA family protein [Rhabdochromatium marinum]|uniref:DciA family protein n=1 Tax=Rhabdochromatium marinum TaxID=48729 RepID=UPI0019058302|nr:DciA family protein [Rhabdochromatium marinum]MBK1648516.1 hypothetical protein [Rhabdochromatium marinum]